MSGCEDPAPRLVGVSQERDGNAGWLTLIIQLDTWLMLKPVAWHSCFFSSSLGYGWSEWRCNQALR